MQNPLYLPREDSLLLGKAVKEYAYGKCLDMGTGSGFLAKTAVNNGRVTEVLGVDVNTGALVYAKKKNADPRISYMQSDMFSKVKDKFDTIIFNPPYLPLDPKLKDVALDGGKKGYEVSVRFLKEAKKFLKNEGIILFLFSSLTDKEVIDKTLIENAYLFDEVQKQKLDFETLYVYRIKKLESLIRGVRGVESFAKGKRGLIYTAKHKGKKVAIKVRNPKSTTPARIYIEGKNLTELNKQGIGPKLVKADGDFVMYEFVEGEFFPDFVKNSQKKQIIEVISQIFLQMRKLDISKISKEEMTNPYKHIVVGKDNKEVMLDFERSKKTLRPSNITQFCQYLSSDKLNGMLKEKGIVIDKKKVYSLARQYKKNYDEKTYKKIISLVK